MSGQLHAVATISLSKGLWYVVKRVVSVLELVWMMLRGENSLVFLGIEQ
jgi:hypothetical protein